MRIPRRSSGWRAEPPLSTSPAESADAGRVAVVITRVPGWSGRAHVVGALSGFIGYLVAFLWALPVGASQALVAVAFALLAETIGRARRI